MNHSSMRTALLGVCISLLTACGQSASETQAPPHRPPPEVSVVTAHSQTETLTHELVGRLAATRVAQVRARVAGIVLKRVYKEGTDVRQGQVLFQIDPAPLEAAVNAKKAALAKAQADAANAALTLKRYRNLSAKHVLSQQDLDTAQANGRSTAAAVQQAQADLVSAKLDLGYATVKAPISGRAGRALVDEGALVGQGDATLMTSIEQIDPIYVNFSLPVAELEQWQQANSDNAQRNGGAQSGATVEVVLPSGTRYAERGTVDFSDEAVDPGTGTVSLRAVLANPKHRLLPGMFVSLRLAIGRIEHAYVLPQAALARDQRGAYVMVVGGDGKVEQRRVETHGMTRSDWIVTGKLKDGDRVIVEGLQKVHAGAPAKAVAAPKASQ